MKMNIYAIKDSVVGAFMQPFYLVNDEAAKRSFRQAMKDESSQYSKIAGDLQLFRLGEFDDESGEIKGEVEFLENGTNTTNN